MARHRAGSKNRINPLSGTHSKKMRGISACIHQFDALDLGLSIEHDWGTWGTVSPGCMLESDRIRNIGPAFYWCNVPNTYELGTRFYPRITGHRFHPSILHENATEEDSLRLYLYVPDHPDVAGLKKKIDDKLGQVSSFDSWQYRLKKALELDLPNQYNLCLEMVLLKNAGWILSSCRSMDAFRALHQKLPVNFGQLSVSRCSTPIHLVEPAKKLFQFHPGCVQYFIDQENLWVEQGFADCHKYLPFYARHQPECRKYRKNRPQCRATLIAYRSNLSDVPLDITLRTFALGFHLENSEFTGALGKIYEPDILY